MTAIPYITTSRPHTAYGVSARPAGEERLPAGTRLRVAEVGIVVTTVVLSDDDRVVGILGILREELEADLAELKARAAELEAELGTHPTDALERADFERRHNLLPR
jgi:hypothetical protein